MKEVWKDLKGYEGTYQLSNFGRIKSMSRSFVMKNGGIRSYTEKIMRPSIDKGGYYVVGLWKNSKKSTKRLHKLIAINFMDHVPCGHKLVVNHKNFDKTDNRVLNLEIITQRENANRKHLQSTSKFVGVYWDKKSKKWRSTIVIDGKDKNLGSFDCEIKASEAYQNELRKLQIRDRALLWRSELSKMEL